MPYELIIAGGDPVAALLDCARHGVPGPVIVDNYDPPVCHALLLGDGSYDTEDTIRSWYDQDAALLGAIEVR